MQYTLRNIPKSIDRALREEAARSGKSLNEVAIEALMRGAGVSADEAAPRRKLADVAGTWVADEAVDAALAAQRAIDDDMWR